MLKTIICHDKLQETTDKQPVTESVKFIFVKTNSFLFLFLIVKRKYNVHYLIIKQ